MMLKIQLCITLVLSRYQNVCIRYQYQWKSTVIGTNFCTKAKDGTMLIKKHTIFINKIKQKYNLQKSMPFFVLI